MGGAHSIEGEEPYFDFGGQFSISLPNLILTPGELIQGTISIQNEQEIPPFTLLLGIYGESRSYWSRTYYR